MTTRLALYRLAEAAFGRSTLQKLGRFLYQGARRELTNTPEINGEYRLLDALAPVAMQLRQQFGGVCLDVGAYHGNWTGHLRAGLARHKALDGVSFHCFEPAPSQGATLLSRLNAESALPSVDLVAAAVADREGEATFVITGQDSGNSALASGGPGAHAGPVGETVTVPVVALDSWARNNGIGACLVVKVDTEGNDFNVIRGAEGLLASGRIGLMQFEYNHRWVGFGHTLAKVSDLFGPTGYKIGQVTPDGLEIRHTWHPELERFIETNFAIVYPDMLTGLPYRMMSHDASNTRIAGPLVLPWPYG